MAVTSDGVSSQKAEPLEVDWVGHIFTIPSCHPTNSLKALQGTVTEV